MDLLKIIINIKVPIKVALYICVFLFDKDVRLEEMDELLVQSIKPNYRSLNNESYLFYKMNCISWQ